ncbi:MAG: aminoglycoside 6-adenylyltransferase [Chloroflexota bacterium]
MNAARDALLERITAWAGSRNDVRGALLVGSAARSVSPADEHSDLDVVLFVTEPRAWLDEASWVREIGDPWVTFIEPTGVGHGWERRVLFADGVDVDFSLFPPPDASDEAAIAARHIHGVLQRGARALADPEGFLATMLDEARAAPPVLRAETPSAAELANLVGDLLYHVVWTARKALRGEGWVAAECINGHMAPNLARLATWHAVVVNGVTDTWHAGRFLERWADPRAVSGLARSLTDTTPQRMGEALAACLELCELLAGELGPPIGQPYPTDAHRRVAAWLREHPIA